jgi:hypothetical protein
MIQTTAFAASNAFQAQPELYRMAVKDLPLEKELLVQRRIKEALLKASIVMGVPRTLQSLVPLFREFKEDGIDTFAPRYGNLHFTTERLGFAKHFLTGRTEELNDPDALKRREKRGTDIFTQLFTEEGARGNAEMLKKYIPDACMFLLLYFQLWLGPNVCHPDLILNKWGYEYWWGEDRILSLIETEVVMAVAITCTNAPRAAVAHTRGIVRVGGSKDLAERAQNMALEIAGKYNAATGDIELVKDIDFELGLDLKKW